jgi:hypothetical protein
MASTYRPIEAFDKVKIYIKSMPLDSVGVRVLDQTLKMMWMVAPWRWTISDLPVTTLASDTQDYSLALPSDFLYGYDAYYTDGDDTTRALVIEPALPADLKVIGMPTRIAITGTAGSTGVLRTAPKPGTLTGTYDIISLYKKISPVFTASNIYTAGTQVIPDEWFWVFEEGALYQAYKYADDQRAGSAQVDPISGRIQYTGQRAIFEAALLQMIAREKLPLIEPSQVENRRTRG